MKRLFAGGIAGAAAATPPGARRRAAQRAKRGIAGAVASVLGLAVVATASVIVAPAAFAEGTPPDSGAYSRASSGTENYSDWMSTVQGSTPIWQMSIPGTHDSYTSATRTPSAQTQTMSVPEQLKMGIRAIDLRLQPCTSPTFMALSQCWNKPDQFLVVHGIESMGITLSGVLDQLDTFLAAHPAEFVIVRAKVENEGRDFSYALTATLAAHSSRLWAGDGQSRFENPSLDQVRGKIVLLKEFPDTRSSITPYGIDYNDSAFTIQDDWYLPSNWSLNSKWESVVGNWSTAVGYAKSGGAHRGFINFLSGNGALPYFVASGYSSENGPPLITGDLNSDKYPDFHRSGASTLFTGINILMYDVLSDQNRAGRNHAGLRGQNGMGLTYIDFPGQPLVSAIVASNPYYGGGGIIGPVVSGVDGTKCIDLYDARGIAGTKIEMWDCNRTSAQSWSINKNGTVTLAGGCMDINGGEHRDGALIHWWPCNGGSNQQWRAENGQLRNPASGKCLDDPNGRTANGTQLVLWSCNGGANQKWKLPPLTPSMTLSASTTRTTDAQPPVLTVRMPADATGGILFSDYTPPGVAKSIGSAPIVAGVATLGELTRTLPLGQNVIQAFYAGDASYSSGNSDSVTVTVMAQAEMTLSASAAMVEPGEDVTLTVEVPADFTGDIGFYAPDLPASNKGFGIVKPVDGVARLEVPQWVWERLGGGPHLIYAQSDGDSRYSMVFSNEITVTVSGLSSIAFGGHKPAPPHHRR